VETDKSYYYFVASWRGLWSWNSYRVAEGGWNIARLKCQKSNCSANKRHCSRRRRSIALRGDVHLEMSPPAPFFSPRLRCRPRIACSG
jgi:hypothetical protein